MTAARGRGGRTRGQLLPNHADLQVAMLFGQIASSDLDWPARLHPPVRATCVDQAAFGRGDRGAFGELQGEAVGVRPTETVRGGRVMDHFHGARRKLMSW